MIITKDNKEYTCAINCSDPADVLFINVETTTNPIETNADQIVLIIPYSELSHSVRANCKRFSSYYAGRDVTILDIDQTFPTHKRLRLSMSDRAPLDEIIRDFLTSQNYFVKS